MAANPGDVRDDVSDRRMTERPMGDRQLSERRRYNRRQSDTQPAPPYFETFDRIAAALEGIEHALEQLSRRVGEAPAPVPGQRDDVS